jgi:DNA topoisomerase-3
MVKILLSKGEVMVEGLYSKKTGKTYNAYVSIEDTGKYINYKMRF